MLAGGAGELHWAPVLGAGRQHVLEPSREKRSRVLKSGRDRKSGAECEAGSGAGQRWLPGGAGELHWAPVLGSGRQHMV